VPRYEWKYLKRNVRGALCPNILYHYSWRYMTVCGSLACLRFVAETSWLARHVAGALSSSLHSVYQQWQRPPAPYGGLNERIKLSLYRCALHEGHYSSLFAVHSSLSRLIVFVRFSVLRCSCRSSSSLLISVIAYTLRAHLSTSPLHCFNIFSRFCSYCTLALYSV
jgi:hypothetical protein